MFPFGSGKRTATTSSSKKSYNCDRYVTSNPGYVPMKIKVPFGAGYFKETTHFPSAHIPYPISYTLPYHTRHQNHMHGTNQRPIGFNSNLTASDYLRQGTGNRTAVTSASKKSYDCDRYVTSNPGYKPMKIKVPFGAGYFKETTHFPSARLPYSVSLTSPYHTLYKNQDQTRKIYQHPIGFNPNLTQFASRYRWTRDYLRQGTPTVFPKADFDARADSGALRTAMKGWGCDDSGLIEILCRRSNQQRQDIQKVFKTDYGKDLIENIKGETRGNFEDLLVALLTPTLDFYCKEIYDACDGVGTDEGALIEVLCTLSNNEINAIKDRYQELYGKDVESLLISETSGNFKRMLVSLLCANRDESGVTDPDKAKEDATALLRAGELRMGTDESVFNSVLCQRNYEQLRLIFKEYETMTGHSFEKAIKNEFSGDIREGFLAIFRVIMNKAEFFAHQLHKSMAGLGTSDKQLIRLVVTRCEIDMVEIKEAHERLFGESLKSMIKGDTSGSYKHALYALIGEERSS